MHSKNYILIFLLLVCFSSSAQDFTLPLTTYLDTEKSKFPIPNFELVVSQNDSLIYHYSEGADGGLEKCYIIGSISKPLTAYAIMVLVDQGRLQLEDNITAILPEVKFSDPGVTIRNLLQHTSGIAKVDGFKQVKKLGQLSADPVFIECQQAPGQQHEYSNLNYALLGKVIEKVSGLHYEQFIQTQLFDVFDMQNSSASQDVNGCVNQYQNWFGFSRKTKTPSFDKAMVPAGFIQSSALDLTKFMNQILRAYDTGQTAPISPELLRQMHEPWNKATFGYGMGWKKGWMNDQYFLQHLGSTGTSYGGIFLFPEQKKTVVFLSNSNSLMFTESIMKGALQIITGVEPEPAKPLEKYAKTGMGVLLIIGLLNFLYFLFRGKNKKSRKAVWKSILSQGAFIGLFIGLFSRFAKIPFGSFFTLQPDIGWFTVITLGLPIMRSIFVLIKNDFHSNQ